MQKDFGAFIVGTIYLSALFLLVRPGSKGSDVIGSLGNSMTNLIKASTGGGTWSG